MGGSGSGARSRGPTFEDLDELDQRNGWPSSPAPSPLASPDPSPALSAAGRKHPTPLAAAVAASAPPAASAVTAAARLGFGDSGGPSGGSDLEFGAFAVPAAPPLPTGDRLVVSSNVQASSASDFDIFGFTTSPSPRPVASGASAPVVSGGGAAAGAEASRGLTSDNILASLGAYGGGSAGNVAPGSGAGGGAGSLSQAARDLLDRLPDLSFMTAKVLTCTTGTPARVCGRCVKERRMEKRGTGSANEESYINLTSRSRPLVCLLCSDAGATAGIVAADGRGLHRAEAFGVGHER
jgi:hypothetical protein